MKYTITHTAEWVLVGIITILFCYTAYKSYQLKQKVETVLTDTIYITDSICDTITQFQPYDIYHYRTDTAYLPLIETMLDTVTDSVFVEVPISMYRYDSTITDTSHTTRIHAVIQGFAVSLDTLSVNTEIIKQEPKIAPKKWYQHLCPAVGIGFGTGGQIGVFAGVGYKL